jgi:hypothetical protein
MTTPTASEAGGYKRKKDETTLPSWVCRLRVVNNSCALEFHMPSFAMAASPFFIFVLLRRVADTMHCLVVLLVG